MPHRHRVLMVEDDPSTSDALQEVLAAAGIDAVAAPDGVEALDRLRADPAFCAVVLDLMMPKMDGWEFRLHQTRDTAMAQVPVVVVSGGGSLEEKASSLHAAAYLTKPPDPENLVAAVVGTCRRDAAVRGAQAGGPRVCTAGRACPARLPRSASAERRR